jgi:hypothetical protein
LRGHLSVIVWYNKGIIEVEDLWGAARAQRRSTLPSLGEPGKAPRRKGDLGLKTVVRKGAVGRWKNMCEVSLARENGMSQQLKGFEATGWLQIRKSIWMELGEVGQPILARV